MSKLPSRAPARDKPPSATAAATSTLSNPIPPTKPQALSPGLLKAANRARKRKGRSYGFGTVLGSW